MPDDADRPCADESSLEGAPPRRGPLGPRERMDGGCLALMMLGFVGIFAMPAFFLLGGAPLIIPLITLFMLALVTPFLNPAERKSRRARWVGRLVVFLVLALSLGAAWAAIFLGEAPLLRE